MRATYIPPIRRSINQDVLFGSVNPTGLAEAVPIGGNPAAITPFENLLVRSAGEHPLAQVSVLDVEEREAMAVEFAAQVVLIGLGKVAACMQNYPRK